MANPPKSSDSEWTITKLLEWTTSYFKSYEIDSPRAAAEILLAHTLNLKRLDLYLRYDQPLNNHELAQFKALIKRRVNREPVSYIVGVKEFWSMDFAVSRDVLIPRPETECLVEAAVSLLPEDVKPGSEFGPQRILEIGTGSGAIILALASQKRHHFFWASDRSIKALTLARKNAERHRLNKNVLFFCGDWLAPLSNNKYRFDMILSNPPYIQTQAVRRLPPEIAEYEPIMALDGGQDGLDCLRIIIEGAHLFLNANGRLLLEIGHDQKTAVTEIIAQCGHYENVLFQQDYSGYDRVVQMQKKP